MAVDVDVDWTGFKPTPQTNFPGHSVTITGSSIPIARSKFDSLRVSVRP